MEILVGKIPGSKASIALQERDNLIKIIRNNGFSCYEFMPNSEMLRYQNSLCSKTDANNFSVYLSNIYFWPRDLFLYFKDKNIIIKDPSNEFHVGEGGYSVSSPVDSNNIFLSEYLIGNHAMISREQLPGVNIFNIEMGRKENGKKLKHIDLTCFYSGEHETLFVDQNFYQSSSKESFKKIKDRGVDVVFFNEEKHISYNYYPANCLSVSKNHINETVFINEASVDLKNILAQDYGMDLVSVKMYKNPQLTGSMRCASNIFESPNPKKFINLLNEINLNMFKSMLESNMELSIVNQ